MKLLDNNDVALYSEEKLYVHFDYEESDGEITITNYYGNADHVIVPSVLNGKPVATIDDFAFFGNASIESVVIPEEVRRIGVSSFSSCGSLKKVTILGEASLDRWSFSECGSLVIFKAERLLDIDGFAFFGCEKLDYIEGIDAETHMSTKAFYRSGLDSQGVKETA